MILFFENSLFFPTRVDSQTFASEIISIIENKDTNRKKFHNCILGFQSVEDTFEQGLRISILKKIFKIIQF